MSKVYSLTVCITDLYSKLRAELSLPKWLYLQGFLTRVLANCKKEKKEP